MQQIESGRRDQTTKRKGVFVVESSPSFRCVVLCVCVVCVYTCIYVCVCVVLEIAGENAVGPEGYLE